MNRRRLPEAEIERIRCERYHPRPTQHDYLHLKGLLGKLQEVFQEIPVAGGPALDLYCGTQPYREIIPWRPLWGLDKDLHFGRADVVAHEALPFKDGAFPVVTCTQALCVVYDPQRTVDEMFRVMTPGGYVVATVARMFRREVPHQRRFSSQELDDLFAKWADVRVQGIGGPGAGFAFVVASFAAAAARRWRVFGPLLPPIALTLNGLGATLDLLLGRLSRRWPACIMVVARRPDG